jgi:hypothetical protein
LFAVFFVNHEIWATTIEYIMRQKIPSNYLNIGQSEDYVGVNPAKCRMLISLDGRCEEFHFVLYCIVFGSF